MAQLDKNNKLQIIKSRVDQVPASPGCYLWKNKDNEVIYVGKAKRLRNRMKQYLDLSDNREKIPLLVEDIDSFEYVVVKNEEESLILEKNLINKYNPYYNVDFKDDKSYPFIALTMGDVFPAIKYTREKHISSSLYFGPYTDSRAARRMVDLVRKIIPICSYSCSTWRKLNKKNFGFTDLNLLKKGDISDISCKDNKTFRLDDMSPCFDCHVGIGPGACCGKITPLMYRDNLTKVIKFLNGYQKDIVDTLSNDMHSAAKSLDFERANRIKKRLDVINALNSGQNIVSQNTLDADVIGFYREETIASAYVLLVREGRISNYNEYILNRGLDVSNLELLHNFLIRYYVKSTSVGKQIIVDQIPDDSLEMSLWLTKKLNNNHGAKVRFVCPKRGEKYELLKMAQRNAKHALLRYKVKNNYDDNRINKALLQLESALALDKSPMRIECYDISTIHGSYTVASMVVFSAGKPDKKLYRHFKIKTKLDEANDFLCMQEVLLRRFKYLTKEDNDNNMNNSFNAAPDLILLDGGLPQLSAAIDICDKLKLNLSELNIGLAGLAKRDEELFVSWNGNSPIVLPDGSESLYLVKQIRDEAHRFAITFHRHLRDKGMTASLLDEIDGIGVVRKKALLKYFGSFKKLKNASLEEIENSGVVPKNVAKELYLVLRQFSYSVTDK